MRRSLLNCSCVIFVCFAPLLGQGTTLVGAGYANPTNIRVSPGQITTIFVSGLNTVLTKPQKATSLPLPNSLAGISVTINQSSLKQSVAVPLLAVEQLNTCSIAVVAPPPPSPPPTSTPSTVPPECLLTAITLQIPYELTPLPIFAGGSNLGGKLDVTEVVITANGVASKTFAISPITDNLHVVNTCDTFPSVALNSGSCSPAVTHADGTLVTANSPATPNETVVIYAYGLGQTTPAVKSGEATPTPAPTLPVGQYFSRTVAIQFDFRPNAAPSNPYFIIQGVISPIPIVGPIAPTPTFVGLTPGQVGLYQINLPLPTTFPAIQPCTTLSVCTGNPASCPLPILSNVTIDIGGVSSFDGAAICVQPGQ